jgi:hypothetical protein
LCKELGYKVVQWCERILKCSSSTWQDVMDEVTVWEYNEEEKIVKSSKLAVVFFYCWTRLDGKSETTAIDQYQIHQLFANESVWWDFSHMLICSYHVSTHVQQYKLRNTVTRALMLLRPLGTERVGVICNIKNKIKYQYKSFVGHISF